MTDQHTSTPWVSVDGMAFKFSDKGYSIWRKPDSGSPKTLIARLPQYSGENERANAAFICRAVNCHDELVEALDYLVRDGGLTIMSLARCNRLEALVAKAKGEQP